jgi:hypothetical protein
VLVIEPTSASPYLVLGRHCDFAKIEKGRQPRETTMTKIANVCRCCNGTNRMPDYVVERLINNTRPADVARAAAIGCIFCRDGVPFHWNDDPAYDAFTPENIDDFLATMRQQHDLQHSGVSRLTPTQCYGVATSELTDFFEEMKHQAERLFLKRGALHPTFFLLFDNRDDEGFYKMAQFSFQWGNREEKYTSVQQIKTIIRHGKPQPVLAYCFIGEAWTSDGKNGVRPAKDPERNECVQVLAEQRGKPPLFAMSKIMRHALSPLPALGNWASDGVSYVAQGAFFNMFESSDDDAPQGVFYEGPIAEQPKRKVH